jgi:hypothetical protein
MDLTTLILSNFPIESLYLEPRVGCGSYNLHTLLSHSLLHTRTHTHTHTHTQEEELRGMMVREWKAPDLPDDPVERLVAMGFGNRELNQQLLEKHNYQLQAVTNELLDLQNNCGASHWASTRH